AGSATVCPGRTLRPALLRQLWHCARCRDCRGGLSPPSPAGLGTGAALAECDRNGGGCLVSHLGSSRLVFSCLATGGFGTVTGPVACSPRSLDLAQGSICRICRALQGVWLP